MEPGAIAGIVIVVLIIVGLIIGVSVYYSKSGEGKQLPIPRQVMVSGETIVEPTATAPSHAVDISIAFEEGVVENNVLSFPNLRVSTSMTPVSAYVSEDDITYYEPNYFGLSYFYSGTNFSFVNKGGQFVKYYRLLYLSHA